tara:strand:- start:2345 stop:3130 length:786 start_codon:yes stop_codon:yes gene_type:complete
MWVHNINPTLLKLGPFEVRFYGIVFALGFLVTYLILNHYRKKQEIKISKDDLDNYIIYIILGVVIGSRIFHLFWDIPYYFTNPLKIFAIWEGGLAFHGGLVGILFVTYYFCKKKNLSFWKFADIIAIPAALFLAFGRIANFINGELPGTLSNLPWCVQFPSAEGCRHPSQIYGAIKRFIIFFILIALYKKKEKFKDGFVFWMFIALMGLGRLLLDFFRDDPRFLSLSFGQYQSLIMFIIAVFVLLKYYKPFQKPQDHDALT